LKHKHYSTRTQNPRTHGQGNRDPFSPTKLPHIYFTHMCRTKLGIIENCLPSSSGIEYFPAGTDFTRGAKFFDPIFLGPSGSPPGGGDSRPPLDGSQQDPLPTKLPHIYSTHICRTQFGIIENGTDFTGGAGAPFARTRRRSDPLD